MKITDAIVIDDDPILRYNIKKMIGAFLDVRQFNSFGSGYDALDHIQNMNLTQNSRVLILLDLYMPQLEGTAFLKLFEKKVLNKIGQFHIHILSSTNNLDDKKELLQHKLVKGFISKPITMEELETLVLS